MYPTCRRGFLGKGIRAVAGLSLLDWGCAKSPSSPDPGGPAPEPSPSPSTDIVAIVRTRTYQDTWNSLKEGFDLLGGIGPLVRNKTVTIKVNLTGYATTLLGKPASEMYAVNGAAMLALVSILQSLGARRIRIVESASFGGSLQEYANGFGWDIPALTSGGTVEFENTRNLGSSAQYAHLPVTGARMFDFIELNRSYTDTDVFISFAKLKNHLAAGVTLTMKNMFGALPTSLYGIDGPREDAVNSRLGIHDPSDGSGVPLIGERPEMSDKGIGARVPGTIVDICSVRPVDLAIIDGVMSMMGGEGPWSQSAGLLKPLSPGVMVMGRNPVSTDAVATAVMGYSDPLVMGKPPFHFSDNHIRMAHEAGLGIGDIARIEQRGVPISEAVTKFAWL